MSADLFAEFNNSPTSTPPPSQSNHLFGQPPQQQQIDAFDVSGRSNAVPALPAHQPLSSQWPSFQGTTSTSMSVWDQPSHLSQSTLTVDPQQADDDDAWGDFEVAQPTEASAMPKVNTQPPVSSSSDWDSYSAFRSNPPGITHNAAHTPACDLISSGLGDFGAFGAQADQGLQPAWSRAEPRTRVQTKTALSDPNVLFDADDFELQDGGEGYDDFDDFGEFEAVESTPRSKPAPAATSQLTSSIDLLGLDDSPMLSPQKETELEVMKEESRPAVAALSFGTMSSTNKPQPLQSPAYQNQPSVDQRNVKKTTHTSTQEANSRSISVPSAKMAPVTKKVSPAKAKATADDDEWGAWDDFSRDNGDNYAGQESDKALVTDKWLWGAGDDSEAIKAMADDDSSPPPTNVPPPSILLSVFPELFNTGSSLFKSVAGQSSSVKQQVLSNPKTIQFLQGYVLLASTAARVIAGRKRRWHRDKILAKSMSISAAGSKGMKLAGVDKQQSAREDREAADVVTAWREHIGRLRSAVATANSAGKTNIKVPELTETPQIQTAKMVPTAPKPCIVCGLKREERVAKLDLAVEDSFGEWWIEHWGHRACKNFWIEHEQLLRQR